MANSRSNVLWPQLLIVAATLIWGSSFLIMKQAVSGIPVFTLLAVRFTIAAVLLGLFFCKKFQKLDRAHLLGGFLLGLCMFSGYVFQTYGLSGFGSWQGTTPGKNAFLTATYCVLVPLFSWLFLRKKPNRYHLAAAVICILGIAFISLDRQISLVGGDVLTLIGGVGFALHIIAVTHFSGKDCDIILLTVLQFITMAVLSWLGVLVFGESLAALPPTADLFRLLYLGICATGLAMLFQNLGQANCPPTTGALLMSLEAPFGVVFSVLFGDEAPSPQMYLGFFLIFFAVILAETRLSFLPRRKKSPQGVDN